MTTQVRRKRLLDPDEASWATVVEDWAQLHGWFCWHDNDPRRNRAGLPDYILIRPPRVVLLEAKVPGGRLRPEQRDVLALLERCPGVEVLYAVFPEAWPLVRDTLL